MNSKELHKQIQALYKVKQLLGNLKQKEDELKALIMPQLDDGQVVIGKYRITKTFNDHCIIASFERASYHSLTIAKIP